MLRKQRVPEPIVAPRLPPRRLPATDVQLLSRLLGEAGRMANALQDIRADCRESGTPSAADLRAALANVSALRTDVAEALGGRAAEVAP
jgi:hypothetical protein